MYSMLSLLFGLALIGLTYGLSFCPSGSLNLADDNDDAIVLADQDGGTTVEKKAAGERSDLG
jgi:hypothetical protein